MIPVSELFGPTVQGEGYLVGRRTMFIRLAGCDGVSGKRDWCYWCDSMHAVDPANKLSWKWMEEVDIVGTILEMAPHCREVTISGGNPLLHDLSHLMMLLQQSGYRVNVETQGTIYRPWIDKCDIITISPKPPSAGENYSVDQFRSFFAKLPLVDDSTMPCVKVVVDPAVAWDLAFAKDIFNAVLDCDLPYDVPMYLSVITFPTDTTEDLLNRYRELIDVMANDIDLPDVGVLPQLHVLLWGHKIGV